MPTPHPDRDLARLAAAARRAQWRVDGDVDWDRPAAKPRWLPGRAYVRAVSQLYHGELATAEACRRLLAEADDVAARRCLELQIADEGRHAEAYARYLARLGDIAPVDEAVAGALAAFRTWRGPPEGAVVAYHLVLEGEALRVQAEMSRHFPCRLLRDINRRVARDEARHVAFGGIWLGRAAARLSAGARADILRWAEGIWRACAAALLGRPGLSALVPRRARDDWLNHRWRMRARALARTGFAPPPGGPP
jgi:hypothetical protein